MNEAIVDKIVQAVLYEGYNLYPYRPSVKNRCRWTFGGLLPRSYSDATNGTDAWTMQVQCLVQADQDAALNVTVRFLHLMQRTIGVLNSPCRELPLGNDPPYDAVDSLVLDGQHYQTWQEAVERDVALGPIPLKSLLNRTQAESFAFPASHMLERLGNPDGQILAVAIRDQQAINGSAEIVLKPVEMDVFRLTVRIFNRVALENAEFRSRDDALMRALVATHAVMSVRNGKFHSLTDPPETVRQATAACQNRGAWPVLVGAPSEQDAMLASPIILYDYPQIARESPGDLFDGTEIDELLTLRIMTLTEEEKAMAGAIDERTRRLMERTESLAREQLAGLHGATRWAEPASAQARECDGDPFAEQPAITSIRVDDVEFRPGDRVRLRPAIGGDIFDVALNGMTATIESIEQDYENRFHVAVTLDDDPGQDLGRARQPGHRFFFKPEELSPLQDSGAKA
jgi:hypothetical protein